MSKRSTIPIVIITDRVAVFQKPLYSFMLGVLIIHLQLSFTLAHAKRLGKIISSGKKSKSVFDFWTYSREIRFSFSYAKVVGLNQATEASNEIDRVSKFDNSLSFGAKQNALRQIFFASFC